MRLYILSLQGEAIHSPFSSLRGMSEANDKAIYNVEKRKFHNRILKEMQNYRLPRFHKWNLAKTQNLPPCHCERSEAIYNQAYLKDSIAESRVDKVMDLRSAGEFANANARHESRCDSRNDKVEYALVSRHCEAVRKHNEASVAKATDPHLQIHNHANQTILNGSNTQGARQ